MKCVNCGREFENGNFCPECGSSVNSRVINLTITRKKKIFGFLLPFAVYVDNNKIGDLKNGKSLSCQVSDGEHAVVFKCVEKDVKQVINVNVNHNSVEIICHVKIGIIAGVIAIDDVIYR